MMNAIPDNRLGPTTNPLLVVNKGQDGNMNSFITPTLVTNCQNHQGNGNMVAFENTILEADKQINARLVEIANQGLTLETMATSRPDHHVPDRCQYMNNGEHQYQSTYNNQNRSYNNNYNQNYRQTWENHTDRTCNNCGIKGHMSCTCMAASVAMVICAHSPHPIEPLCRGSPEGLSETDDRAKESHSAVTPKRVSLDRTSCCECFGARAMPLEYSMGGA